MTSQKAHLFTLRFSVCEIYTFLDLMERTCTSECTFQSYRCEAACGTARTALYMIVTFSKANYLCSLLCLSQALGTTPWVSGSKSRAGIFKRLNVFKPRSFLKDNLQVKNDSIRHHSSMLKGTFSAENWK